MEMGAGKFKAQCLQLMDLVHDTHQRVVITKRGRPVAQLVAVDAAKPRPVFGRLRGRIESLSDVVGPPPRGRSAEDGRTRGSSPSDRHP